MRPCYAHHRDRNHIHHKGNWCPHVGLHLIRPAGLLGRGLFAGRQGRLVLGQCLLLRLQALLAPAKFIAGLAAAGVLPAKLLGQLGLGLPQPATAPAQSNLFDGEE